MNILLTGGSGDLGQILCSRLLAMGHTPIVIDVRLPEQINPDVGYFEASILDREALHLAMQDCGMVVHIAAWHGIHEYRQERDAYEFWDLNVTGTFNVFEAAAREGIKEIVFISSTSVEDQNGLYGHTKVLGEKIAGMYADRHDMNVITLRPRAFIPPWNKAVYRDYLEWARWFWSGAVHIEDMAEAVCLSVEKLASRERLPAPLTLVVDGAYEYTDEELANWDIEGAGSTFKRHYPQYYALALTNDLDPAEKPHKLDISATTEAIGYKPKFSLGSLLKELAKYGPDGPPPPL
ncbi:MAG: NAD(P)-dependent oxidoreductase [Cyanobacteria bacterium SZAS TMP-1]|nr:NAD(P)-dependent oxidoreductase [Cyanobacteria bacterium SZAS TMP-1]